MGRAINIALVGDYNSAVPAHQAIPVALQFAAQTLEIAVEFEWVPTIDIQTSARVVKFDGLWCVPASPYRNMQGALLAIRHAREAHVPFLGTCGGFQHAVIEYARHVLGWTDAEHAESSPHATCAVITPLTCGLLESAGLVKLLPNTHIATAYGSVTTTEEYLCRYGINPTFRAALVSGPLRAAAVDEADDLRAVELDDHPFFVATLFQPERAALKGHVAPLVNAFVNACST